MKMRIICEMVRIFCDGLVEYLTITSLFVVVIGLPVFVVWIVDRVMLFYFGNTVMEIVRPLFLLFLMGLLILASVMDLYKKAKAQLWSAQDNKNLDVGE